MKPQSRLLRLRQFGLIIMVVILGLGAGYLLRGLVRPQTVASPYHTVALPPHLGTVDATHLTTADNLLDPLTIAAQRARTYPGGQLTVNHPITTTAHFQSFEVSYPSDGLKIYAQSVVPTTDRPAKGYPTIILIHGNMPPNAYRSNNTFYTQFADSLASHGYLVVMPDLRGFGYSWGTATGGYFSPDYTADVLNLYTSLSTYHQVDHSRIALFGHSMGGHVALNVLAVAGGAFKSASIAAGGVGAMNDMLQHWQAQSDFKNPAAETIRQREIDLHGQPNSSSPFWSQVDPYSFLSDIHLPIQLQVDDDDGVIPPRFTSELADGLTAAGNPPELVTYPTGGHIFAGQTYDKMVDAMVAFFDRTV